MESQDLQKAGLKATLPRLKILKFLEETEHRHMSAEDVYKAMLEQGEEIGLATIYRVLTQFESAGLVTRHHFEGGHSVFELRDYRSFFIYIWCLSGLSERRITFPGYSLPAFFSISSACDKV